MITTRRYNLSVHTMEIDLLSRIYTHLFYVLGYFEEP